VSLELRYIMRPCLLATRVSRPGLGSGRRVSRVWGLGSRFRVHVLGQGSRVQMEGLGTRRYSSIFRCRVQV